MSEVLFLFYKAFSLLLLPLGLTLLFLVIALVLYRRGKNRAASWFLACSILWLWLWSTPLWSDLVRGRLESEYAYRPAAELPVADAIVVLGGGVRGYAGPSLPLVDLNRAADRELFAAQLYHARKAKLILLGGGADAISRTGVSALGMKTFLINLGVPSSAVMVGATSRNTAENLEEVVRMMNSFHGRSVLLVTSALHMPRAFWLFSRSGLLVTPAPTDFEVVKTPFSLYRLLPDAEALENSTRAARESAGLFAYRLGLH
jgi:uncharacterized SAM-binding protein YcdF (DUF218 family)